MSLVTRETLTLLKFIGFLKVHILDRFISYRTRKLLLCFDNGHDYPYHLVNFLIVYVPEKPDLNTTVGTMNDKSSYNNVPRLTGDDLISVNKNVV